MARFPQRRTGRVDYLSWLMYVSVGAAAISLLYFLWVKWLHAILDTDGLAPHGFCFLWNPGLVILHAGSDTLIGLSYVSISATLIYFVCKARHDLPFHWMFAAFGIFIIACGCTHLLDVWTLWYANYWLSGMVKVITAIASIATAVVLPPLIPKAYLLIEAARTSEERKRKLEETHRELEVLYEKTKELDRLKTEFFANVSHELRTPLTLILGSTRNLLAENQNYDLQVIERNALTLLKHVNDLLDVVKLEAGHMLISYAQVDIVSILQHCLSLFDRMARERQIFVSLEAPPSLPMQADPEKLQRIFLNLLSNAFKFTPTGGNVHCLLSSTGERVRFIIQDSGPGVRPELRQAIFERFRQAENSLTRRSGGTGLGLAIVKEFVELHGGTVTVDDAPLGGASFIVELPLLAPVGTPIHSAMNEAGIVEEIAHQAVKELSGEPETDANVTLPQAGPGEPLVLVVEDNRDMSLFISRILATTYRVATAFDGQEGLTKALTLKPDLIVCDLMMPMMSGAEFVERVRQQQGLDATPIVILSARADDMLRVKLLRDRVQDYLVKPFYSEELRVRVANLIAMKCARQALQEELADRNQDIMVLINEITTRKHELQAMLIQLEQANKIQSDFIAIVSHEFRTTLTGIQGFSELLRDENFSAEEVKEYAADISADALRLTRMINELLDLERMKSGRMKLHLEMLDLNAILADIVQRTRPTAAHHTIELQVDESLPLLSGDRDKLTQVVTNLMSNAIKYSPDGGTILLQSHKEDQIAHVSIRDQGIGIPDDALETIFNPYHRVEGAAGHYIGGTGLGLPIVRQIIQMHGGRVWAESTPGQGSTFHFTLPITHS